MLKETLSCALVGVEASVASDGGRSRLKLFAATSSPLPINISMPSSPQVDYAQEISELVDELSLDPEREPAASEIGVLQSIYGDEAIRLWRPSADHPISPPAHKDTIRYEARLKLEAPHDTVVIRVLVSLPPSYPATTPPQLQLLDKYIGPFSVDSSIFGSTLRTYISINGVEWTADTVCVFDGLQNVIERCTAWYGDKLNTEKAGDLVREEEREKHHEGTPASEQDSISISLIPSPVPALMPDGIQIVETEPIVDRKSSFVGRACHITDPSQVPLILNYLQSDRRIARAAHPIINAWRCQVNGVVHQDNDDDGETAAGGRLAHLLQILEVNNVLVVVTRYWGGIHLGPDRFKHINQAARNALEAGGFLEADDNNNSRKHPARGRKK